MIIYQKTIDRSTLRQGFQIPIVFHPLLELMPGGMLHFGETRSIKILIDGIEYDAQLKNQAFNREKYKNHPNIIQIRYGENSPISRKLREIFHCTWEFVGHIKSMPDFQSKKIIHIPEEQRETLALSATSIPNVFIIDYITNSLKTNISSEIEKINELDFETIDLRLDKNASIKKIYRMQKIRILDRSIGDSLKLLYNYRCQMSGEQIGSPYGAMVAEAHHIIPFTESMNNDTSNIIILSPNYHRIIHRTNASFNRDKLAFIFPNGLVEKVKINLHLNP